MEYIVVVVVAAVGSVYFGFIGHFDKPFLLFSCLSNVPEKKSRFCANDCERCPENGMKKHMTMPTTRASIPSAIIIDRVHFENIHAFCFMMCFPL